MGTRRRNIDQFARERTGDPSMTAKEYKETKKIKRTKEFNWSVARGCNNWATSSSIERA